MICCVEISYGQIVERIPGVVEVVPGFLGQSHYKYLVSRLVGDRAIHVNREF